MDDDLPTTDNGWHDLELERLDRITTDVDGKTNLHVPLAGDGDDPYFANCFLSGRKRQPAKGTCSDLGARVMDGVVRQHERGGTP